MNFSGYVGHVTSHSWMLTHACCLVVGLGLGLGLDLVSGWLVVIHTYLCYSSLSLSLSKSILHAPQIPQRCIAFQMSRQIHPNRISVKNVLQ